MSKAHDSEIARRDYNVSKLAALDPNVSGSMQRARTLINATIRHTYDNVRLAVAQNTSSNYTTPARAKHMRRWEDKHTKREASLQERWAYYGLHMDWPGLYPTIDSLPDTQGHKRERVIDPVFYEHK